MRRSYLLFAVVSIILSGCDGKFFSDQPSIYDPEQAGATIVESFNITGQIPAYKPDVQLVGDNYHMVLYGDKIYINTGGKVLYVFEKSNFTKTDEIRLTLGEDNITKIGNVTITPGWWSYNIFKGDNLAIIDERHGFLLCESSHPYETHLLSLDLETSTVALIDGLEEKTGMEPDSLILGIGYDKESDHVWFSVDPTPPNANTIYFFDYNSLEGIFTLKSKIEPIRSKFMLLTNIFISGDNLFRTGYVPASHPSRPKETNIGVEKYLVSNSEERLYFINAEYLGTKTIPQNIIYDEPYIWMMVERDNQIQMLKLLPND